MDYFSFMLVTLSGNIDEILIVDEVTRRKKILFFFSIEWMS